MKSKDTIQTGKLSQIGYRQKAFYLAYLAQLSLRWPRDSPYSLCGCSENFRESLSSPWLLFPKFLMGICFDRSYECAYKIWSSWDNEGASKKLGNLLIRARSLFYKIFNGLLFVWTLWMYRRNLKSVALPVPEMVPIEVLGGGCKPSILGKKRPYRGSGMAPFKRALVISFRPSIVTFPPSLSLRVSEILPLLCSSTPLFPNPL